MTASFHKEGMIWPIKLAKHCHFIVICLYQARKLSGHVFVLLEVSILFLSTFSVCYGNVPFCDFHFILTICLVYLFDW